jgi:ankyrin repeat protein
MLAIDKSPGALETAAFLLRHGAAASVNAVSPACGSALSRACSAGNVPLLHMLISHGANVSPPAPATPPLLLALDGGHEEVVSALLLLGADARAVDTAGRQALLVAVRGGHGGAARALLESGADARASDGAGTALAAAARKGCAEAVRALLQHGAGGLEASTGDGTPLQVAAREGHLEAVRANCAAVEAAGCSALLLACVHGGKAPLVALLCASGANANAAATGAVAGTCIIAGTTPLMAAAASAGSLDAVKVLLQRGATPHAKDSAGREARDYALTQVVQKHLKGLP